jgi:hypothetical protein
LQQRPFFVYNTPPFSTVPASDHNFYYFRNSLPLNLKLS